MGQCSENIVVIFGSVKVVTYGGNLCFITIFPKNVISLTINSAIPGNTITTKYFSCAYQLQCIGVFIGKLQVKTQKYTKNFKIYFSL